MEFPSCPPTLKQIQHFLKIAQEHDGRDLVVAYWARLYALQIGLKLSTQQPDETKLLLSLMDWLEQVKRDNADNDAITNDVAAQAHLENYALKLFLYADKQDRESNFGKNVVKAFYSSGVLYDILQTFGELTEEAIHNRKYAKWKAAYIHNCLKNGETPEPGPSGESNSSPPESSGGDIGGGGGGGGGSEASAQDTAGSSPDPPQEENDDNKADEENRTDADADANTGATAAPTAEEVLDDPDKLPSPPQDEEKPGGFEPYVPPVAHSPYAPTPYSSYTPTPSRPYIPATDVILTPEQMMRAQKYCKYAGSALNYDDVKTAIENLQKALNLLTTGKD